MADNSPSDKASGIKKAWADPKARKGILLSGGILVVVAVVALTMTGRPPSKIAEAPSSATNVPPPNGQRDVTAQAPEQYKQLVADSDRERAEKAKANPTSVVMPTLAGFSNDDDAKRREAAERGRQAAIAQGQQSQPAAFQTSAQAAGVGNGQQGVSPTELARASREYIKTTEFLTGVITGAVSSPLTPILNHEVPKVVVAGGNQAPGAGAAGAGGSASSNANSGAGGASAANTTSATPLVRVGEIVFGTTDIAMNTDYSGPVTATIHQGKFSGYRLIGQKTLERDALVIKFNLMSPADGGAALPVNAYAVSMGDAQKYGLTGLEGNTDNHIFQRYVLPAAVAFVQSYGLSGAQTGSTAVVSNGGAVGTSTPGLSGSARVGVALGGAMGPLMADVAAQSSRPISVSLPAQTEIGIMFAADVLPGGKMGASVTLPDPQANAAQPARALPMQVPQAYSPYGAQTIPGAPTYGAQTYPGTPGYQGGYRYPQ